jgi:hypothetical protein
MISNVRVDCDFHSVLCVVFSDVSIKNTLICILTQTIPLNVFIIEISRYANASAAEALSSGDIMFCFHAKEK